MRNTGLAARVRDGETADRFRRIPRRGWVAIALVIALVLAGIGWYRRATLSTGEIRSLVRQAAGDLRNLPLDDGVRHDAVRDVVRALDHAALYQDQPVPNVHRADLYSVGSGSAFNVYTFNIIDRHDEPGSWFDSGERDDSSHGDSGHGDDDVFGSGDSGESRVGDDGVCLTLTEHGTSSDATKASGYRAKFADGACPE